MLLLEPVVKNRRAEEDEDKGERQNKVGVIYEKNMAQGERAKLTAITAPIDGNYDSGGRLLFAAAFVKPVGTNIALFCTTW